MIGVFVIFIWGPPQPFLELGPFIGGEGGGDPEVLATRRLYTFMSRLGLFFLLVGFAFEAWAELVDDHERQAAVTDQERTDHH